MEIAAYLGFPSPVRQAERVWVQERKTALTERILTSLTRTADSSGESARKMMRAAGPARKNNPSAQGTETARVTKSANSIRFLDFFAVSSSGGFAFLPAEKGGAGTGASFGSEGAEAAETAGTLAAAMP